MPRRLPILLLAAILLASPALAGTNQDAYFTLHWVPVTSEVDSCGVSDPNAQGIPCSDYTVTAPLGEGYVYVVVANAGDEGVAGVEFGITFAGFNEPMVGIDPATLEFTLCGDGWLLHYAEYSQAALYRTLHRDYYETTCYEHPTIGSDGRHALIGYFYVEARSEDLLRIVLPAGPFQPLASPSSGGNLLIAACTEEGLVDLAGQVNERAARVHFGGDGSQAFNPCLGSVPVETTTWGSLKTLYRN